MTNPRYTFRMSQRTIDQLDFLVRITGAPSRTAVLVMLIEGECDRLNGNPKLLSLLEQMRSMAAQIHEMSSSVYGLDEVDPEGSDEG